MALTFPRKPQLKVVGSPVGDAIDLGRQGARQLVDCLGEDHFFDGGWWCAST
jgi:hypothetical protein